MEQINFKEIGMSISIICFRSLLNLYKLIKNSNAHKWCFGNEIIIIISKIIK